MSEQAIPEPAPFALDVETVSALDELMDQCPRRVASVEVTYAGGGDEGQIEEVELFDAAGKLVPANTERLKEVAHAFAGLADELVDQVGADYRNDEGGYGTVTFDLTTRQVELDHNDYVRDSVNSQWRFIR